MEASDASDVAGDGTGDASEDTDMADAGEKASSDSASSQELIFCLGNVYKCILLQFNAAAFLQSFRSLFHPAFTWKSSCSTKAPSVARSILQRNVSPSRTL